jgi:hypothetical protein
MLPLAGGTLVTTAFKFDTAGLVPVPLALVRALPVACVPCEPALVRGGPLTNEPAGVFVPQGLVCGPPMADFPLEPVLVPFVVCPDGAVGPREALFVGREGVRALIAGLLWLGGGLITAAFSGEEWLVTLQFRLFFSSCFPANPSLTHPLDRCSSKAVIASLRPFTTLNAGKRERGS